MGLCQGDNLFKVGRISQDFLVAGNGSIKNDFADCLPFNSNRLSIEQTSIFQCQQCRIIQYYLQTHIENGSNPKITPAQLDLTNSTVEHPWVSMDLTNPYIQNSKSYDHKIRNLSS